MLKEIKLYGELGKKYGKIHKLAVENSAEAIRALCANFRGFEQDIANGFFKIFLDKGAVDNLSELDAHGIKTIKIIPVVEGAKSGGGLLIVGSILLAVATFGGSAIIEAGLAAGLSFGAGMAAVSAIGTIGLGLALTGASQLLTPTPKAPAYGQNQDTPSYLFNGPVNTSVQGVPVPLFYGRLIVGSAIISAGLTITEIPVS